MASTVSFCAIRARRNVTLLTTTSLTKNFSIWHRFKEHARSMFASTSFEGLTMMNPQGKIQKLITRARARYNETETLRNQTRTRMKIKMKRIWKPIRTTRKVCTLT